MIMLGYGKLILLLFESKRVRSYGYMLALQNQWESVRNPVQHIVVEIYQGSSSPEDEVKVDVYECDRWEIAKERERERMKVVRRNYESYELYNGDIRVVDAVAISVLQPVRTLYPKVHENLHGVHQYERVHKGA